MSPLPPGPLVLTLTLDAQTHTLLTSLRTKYFPSSRNHLAAHLTLFHAIPPRRVPALEAQLQTFCQRPGFDVSVGHPKQMGSRGVMVAIESVKPKNAIEGIHKALLAGMRREQDADKEIKQGEEGDKERLTNQDLMKLAHPHVTVLNKAESEEEVNNCLEEVERVFRESKKGRAVGFELWEYMGGPWKPFKQYTFKGEDQPTAQDKPVHPSPQHKPAHHSPHRQAH
ncbi:uncharacterized protein MKK02DRAFT_39204 [Dioszegia hungarica]|uniref:Uncharacterized protein n=1 Tax=Dioszegia hungarica TaxID=4972 RepID=A0AA38LRL5_9TREE|nr:uncharacterized protein MKK02DRAFT_39204 [Dioszegia hungarica]KAI9633225.1 hypothetical protein MKK02DRAFT_39204 [Dioszegia hungarica]